MNQSKMNRCVIDVGNTSIASALFSDDQILNPTRIDTGEIENLSDVDDLVQQVQKRSSQAYNEIVVCVGVARLRDLMEKYGKQASIKIHFVSGQNSCGAKILYETPETLGPDRIANTIAVTRLFTQPTLVIDCGTAINIDFINSEGHFVGGMIAPGPGTSRDALTHSAPSLPEVPIRAPESLIGTSTMTCIQSGILFGAAALINSVVSQLKQEYGDIQTVVTGGYSNLIFPLIKVEATHDEWLTLRGLGFADIG